MYDRLCLCIDHKDKITEKVVLDKDCLQAYRKRIEINPSDYINKILVKDHDSDLSCEAFYLQIFENNDQLERFLKKYCNYNNKIDKPDLVWNFWELYKANDYEPMVHHNLQLLDDALNDNLNKEIIKLKKLKALEDAVKNIPDIVTDKEKSEYKDKLLKYQNELKNISFVLNIKLFLKVESSIINKLEKYK